MISLECRNESFRKMDAPTRRAKIYNIFAEGGEMTAREVNEKLGNHDMNYVRPRITELVERGMIEECGKRKDSLTNRNVTVWRAV